MSNDIPEIIYANDSGRRDGTVTGGFWSVFPEPRCGSKQTITQSRSKYKRTQYVRADLLLERLQTVKSSDRAGQYAEIILRKVKETPSDMQHAVVTILMQTILNKESV